VPQAKHAVRHWVVGAAQLTSPMSVEPVTGRAALGPVGLDAGGDGLRVAQRGGEMLGAAGEFLGRDRGLHLRGEAALVFADFERAHRFHLLGHHPVERVVVQHVGHGLVECFNAMVYRALGSDDPARRRLFHSIDGLALNDQALDGLARAQGWDSRTLLGPGATMPPPDPDSAAAH
jgi:hypothetical protein